MVVLLSLVKLQNLFQIELCFQDGIIFTVVSFTIPLCLTTGTGLLAFIHGLDLAGVLASLCGIDG